MKRFLFLALLVLFLSPLVFGHEYIMNAGASYTTATVDTQITTLTAGDWDDGYYDMALGASNQFFYYGKKVTHLRISTNGYVLLGFGAPPTGSGTSYIPEPIPKHDDHDSLVAPWWDDWDLTTHGQIWYRIGNGGPGSSNWVTIEWRDVAHESDPAASYDFQVVFFAEYHGGDTAATSGCILFNYMDTDSGTGAHDFAKTGSVGIEHYTGTQGEQFSYLTASLNNSLQILFSPFVPIYDTTDGWADGIPDPVVFRPSNGVWYLRKYDGSITEMANWGILGDVALPGDYDGNGAWNRLVLRPSNYVWYNRDNNPFAKQWGAEGDIPVPADYDGNGVTDLAVFRPKTGMWYVKCLPSETTYGAQWGDQGDIPVPADYDGDGIADLAVYRPSNGTWYIRKSSNPATSWVIPWGADGDIPLPMNIYSTSYTNIAVYRPSNGVWYYRDQTNGSNGSYAWGVESDVPVPGDLNGLGGTEGVVFRPETGTWYSTSGVSFAWGMLGDKPRLRRSFKIVAPAPSGTNSAGDLIQ